MNTEKLLRSIACGIAALAAVSSGANAAIWNVTGSFLGTFASTAPMPTLSGQWTASVDTTNWTYVVGSSPYGTILSYQVAPTTFTMTPNPLVMDPSWLEAFALYNTSNTGVEIVATNGVPTSAGIGGSIFSPTGFSVNYYNNNSLPASVNNPIANINMFYNASVGAGYQYFFADATTGSFALTETQSVSIGPAGTADLLGGSDHGGVSLSFEQGYVGDVVIDPFPSAGSFGAPNFALAMGSGATQFFNITPLNTFDGAVELTFAYDEQSLQIPEQDLAIFHFSSVTGQWEELPSTVFADENVVRATTTGFSVFTFGQSLQQPQTTVPEPGTLALLGLGLAGLATARRRK